ncbi:uncharacterized protein TRAVEDRAFT_28653 [Trametes versicolor FP-101664 SS1]|uniref:uncharacterized protein n=1 Tax=Trametes versicolor (strain FP-101664) TaxID=717944 RepID=UPI00046242EC|nr:uncharacterized protein TRAVEDRAFT_28653 [Trametes versicolor FP-101664 SS1]EIW59522.1 hypothetical protein TRAVEDRAFT_28653 [Trametes versicolor FP-101664 SS1]
MDRLCDEVLQLILNELSNPVAFTLISKRHHEFSKDPYVRASYFLARSGRIQALYWALGRGKLLNERVIDILLSSGAHLSRYLVQCAMHHYFRTQVPFIKTRWVRTIPLPVFSYFLSIAARMYGDIPVAKGEDDGSLLTLLLKQSRFPSEYRAAKWEQVRDVVEKYKFIPFSDRDPMMAQFPLVLAIEPRLLPHARQNGFNMDRKYRNFVFRRMFEKPAIMFESRAEEIVQNVRELSRLDPDMFLSRTVAAEICMEAKTNEPAYTALKRLDKEGVLRFELASVVAELVKLFLNTRSVTTSYTASVLRVLYKDFPSEDPTVRLVLLLTIFLSESTPVPSSLSITSEQSVSLARYVEACHDDIEEMSLGPLTRKDITDVLLSKFVPERFGGILEYARAILKLGKGEMDGIVTDVALGCLEIGCKGRMLKKLVEAHEFAGPVVATQIVKRYRIDIDDLPPMEDEKACKEYSAPLCVDLMLRGRVLLGFEEAAAAAGPTVQMPEPTEPPHVMGSEQDTAMEGMGEEDAEEVEALTDNEEDPDDRDPERDADHEDLGTIGQDTLSAMIRKDEMIPTRRRRYQELYTNYHDSIGKLPYPADYTQVGTWIQNHYGHLSAAAAVVRIHAVINQNYNVLHHHQYPTDGHAVGCRVPTTLKQFKILARLGKSPSMGLYDDIECGTEFYFSEEDYLSAEDLSGVVPAPGKKTRRSRAIKCETSPTPAPPSSAGAGPSTLAKTEGVPASKRPRRSVATSVKSYVVPDSDDEGIADGRDDSLQRFAKKRRAESNMQRWIKHLAIMLKDEQKKYNERKRRIHAATPPGSKVKVPKTEFHKSLAFNLPRLRRIDRAKREKLYGTDVPDEDHSESDEDEYQYRTTRAKRRKVDDRD